MVEAALRNLRRDSPWLIGIVLLLSAAGAGLLAVARVDGVGPLARPEFQQLVSLPLPAYPLAVLGVGALTIASRAWWVGLAMFFAWLPFEDLLRKFADNDLRIYFVKDLLLGLAILGIAPRLKGCWRRPLGTVWLPTMVVFCIAVVYAFPASLVSPSIPFVGIHGRFLYAVLFPVGAYLASDVDRLRIALRWLTILAAAVCALGIVQAIVGPTFLNPSIGTSSFEHLVVTKTLGSARVVRPSGPFADVSRFASMTIVATTLAGCSLRLARDRRERRFAVIALVVSLAGAFASGSRTAVLLAPLVAVLALLALKPQSRRRVIRLLIGAAVALIIGTGLAGGTAATQALSRISLYIGTLNPANSSFEVGNRINMYAANATAGVEFGGLLGNGTGTEAIGKRYLNVEETASQVESGWGSVAAEWGLLGLTAWIAWSVLWTRRAIHAARGGASPIGPVVATYVGSLLLVMFSLGSGFLDNYIANIFFWFLSGAAFGGAYFSSAVPSQAVSRD